MRNTATDSNEVIAKIRKKIDGLKREYQTTREIAKQEGKKARQAERDHQALVEAGEILLAAAAKIQNEVHSRIAGIVTRCLAAVFPDPYEFRIEFVKKRGKTEAQLFFVKNGRRRAPLRAIGGGVTDVAAFVLRVASIMQRRPAPRRIIIADEPFKNVSKEFLPNVCSMLEMLKDELGFQFVIVTHLKELKNVGIGQESR